MQFDGIREALSLHLVEVSPKLSELQRLKLTGQSSLSSKDEYSCATVNGCRTAEESNTCRSHHGVNVTWHQQLADVPRGFAFYVAHEFFDALPIHKFQVSKHTFLLLIGCCFAVSVVYHVPIYYYILFS